MSDNSLIEKPQFRYHVMQHHLWVLLFSNHIPPLFLPVVSLIRYWMSVLYLLAVKGHNPPSGILHIFVLRKEFSMCLHFEASLG